VRLPVSGRPLGLVLIAAGLALALAGVVAYYGGLSWFGRLPGDVRIARDGVRVYVPIVSMLLVSVALSLVLWLVRRFL
jgi:hypothetical protein